MRTRLTGLPTHRFVGVLLAALVALVVLLSTDAADAQQRTLYLDRLQIGGAPEDGFAVWRPRMHERTIFYGQFAVGYSLNPLRGSTAAFTESIASRTPDPVNHQLTTYFSGGIQMLERVSLGVTLPVVAYQEGDNPCQGVGDPRCQTTDPNPAATSDTRIDGRVVAYRNDAETFHLGLAGSAWIPSGDSISFTTDDQTHGALQVMSELHVSKFILALDTGVHFRPDRTLNLLRVGSEWTWAGGVFLPLRDDKMRVGGQVFGSTGITSVSGETTTFTKRNTPLEWLGEVRFALGQDKAGWASFGGGTRLSAGYGAPDVRVLASIGYAFSLQDTDPNAPGRRYVSMPDGPDRGDVDTDKDGIPDDLDLCPDEPEDGAEPDPKDGCPAPLDSDGDGIPDDQDKCPQEPEDLDGIDDLDGCPEDDFDADGVPDVSDKCPREPGQPSADPDKNGCPQFIRRIEGSTEIQILKKVEFATASTKLLPSSFPILDEVVRLLKANPDIERVAIEGHTDSRGAHAMNMTLSQGRAESVMKYLTQKGISAQRLTAKGYGPDKPLDTNDTDQGRQKNRRVEFHIVAQN